MINRFIVAAAVALAVCFVGALPSADLSPARAQFADQATDAGTGAGTANAQTITLANVSSYNDLVGVLVKFIPGATNSGATTLAVNGLATPPSLRKPTGSAMGAFTGGEFTVGQQVVVKLDASGFFNLISPTSLPINAAGLQTSAIGFNEPVNLQINASVSANALTIALKGINGSDASAINPIPVAFRNVTIANGSPEIVSLQAALSFTINSTSTMGCVSGQMCRLWLLMINNGGTAALCAFNALSGTIVAPINEAALQTSASGTVGGNLAQTYYCSTSAVTAKAIRIIGYVDIQEATAGTWATGPTYIQLMGPSIKKPAERVQYVFKTGTTAATTSSASAVLLTGAITQAITPTSAANVIRGTLSGTIVQDVATSSFIQLGRAGPVVIGNPAYFSGGNSQYSAISIGAEVPNVTSTLTYGAYGSISGGHTLSFPPATTGVSIELEEIMGALPEPANDDRSEAPRMVG